MYTHHRPCYASVLEYELMMLCIMSSYSNATNTAKYTYREKSLVHLAYLHSICIHCVADLFSLCLCFLHSRGQGGANRRDGWGELSQR